MLGGGFADPAGSANPPLKEIFKIEGAQIADPAGSAKLIFLTFLLAKLSSKMPAKLLIYALRRVLSVLT